MKKGRSFTRQSVLADGPDPILGCRLPVIISAPISQEIEISFPSLSDSSVNQRRARDAHKLRWRVPKLAASQNISSDLAVASACQSQASDPGTLNAEESQALLAFFEQLARWQERSKRDGN